MPGVPGAAFRPALQPVDQEGKFEPGNVPTMTGSAAATATATTR